MHRANGFTHMVRCAKDEGLAELVLPCWDKPWKLEAIIVQAVTDLRQACTMRSEKYGKKSQDAKSSSLYSYQATLRNLADALEIHARITGEDEGPTGSAWLRQRADTLALTDQRIMAACNAGEELTGNERKLVERDTRLAETAARRVPCPTGGGDAKELCVQCEKQKPTHLGFSCRCLCLCADCAKIAGTRVQECPECGDYTEFIAVEPEKGGRCAVGGS